MSENRKKYSSSPLYGLKGSSRNQGGGFQVRMDPPREKQQQEQPAHSGGNFIFLQVWPVLFVGHGDFLSFYSITDTVYRITA